MILKFNCCDLQKRNHPFLTAGMALPQEQNNRTNRPVKGSVVTGSDVSLTSKGNVRLTGRKETSRSPAKGQRQNPFVPSSSPHSVHLGTKEVSTPTTAVHDSRQDFSQGAAALTSTSRRIPTSRAALSQVKRLLTRTIFPQGRSPLVISKMKQTTAQRVSVHPTTNRATMTT